ncbi:MAG: hypothetical protein DPW09_25115 [Anaerolineae bacterium]|nr:hypothetical protein [Anaerolineales bacterium]MCQ3976723.1 hypothetical protein [Anaerolineae bacterium]
MTKAKSLGLLYFWLIVIAVMGLISLNVVQAAGEQKTLDRNVEPVVVKGIQVKALLNAPIQHLFIYTFTNSGLGGRIPVQVDEVTSAEDYTSSEDGLLDNNDEIVFMAKDLGNRAADTTVLTNTLPISATWYEIKVTDPLEPTKKGWAYLVRSGTLSAPVGDYVNYISATQVISATNYKLGLAATYVGFDELTLNGSSSNILDRTKLRISLPLFGTKTENDLGTPVPLLIKDGPVRVILLQTATAPAGLANLANTYLAYASLLQTTANVSSSLSISKVRTSMDLNSAASGATFYNVNVPGGVTIDSNPDSVVQTPLSRWFQVSQTTGRMIQVTDLSKVGGNTQKNYYCEGTAECDGTAKTGDNVSYGDSGFVIEGNVNKNFTTKNILYFLSPASGGSGNMGTTFEAYFFEPLQICAGEQAGPCSQLFLPLILKGS